MATMKTLKFPGSSNVYEMVDATARAGVASLQTTVGELVDDTLATSGKAADAAAVGAALAEKADDAAVSELKSAINANEYDPTVAYSNGSLVWKDGELYKAKLDLPAETWTVGHWVKTNISAYIAMIFSDVCKRYTPGASYAAGEYVVKSDGANDFVYRAKTNISDATWVSGHWTKLTTNIMETLISLMNTADTSMQNQIDAINAKTTTNLINAKSFEIAENRYNNINYVDLLSIYTTIDKRDSTAAGIDNDIRYRNMPYSIKLTTKSGATTSACRVTFTPAYKLIGTQEIEVCLYVEDATNITLIKFEMLEGGMTKTISDIHTGWNKLRFVLDGAGNMDYTADNVRWQLTVYTTVETNVWIGSVVAIKPDKANVIIVDDGPYKSFYTNAYPSLKNAGIPVTWALDPVNVEDESNTTVINSDDLEVLATDGISEFSFHSYDGALMSSATSIAALYDTLNCIRYLRKNGLEPTSIWRAAWLQNSCTNHGLADLEVDASASYNGINGITQYPYPDKYNIPRYAMQERTTSTIDALFDKLYNTHSTVFFYTHGISTSSGDLTQELFNYYLSKITDGISNGWLNATTYNRLKAHYMRLK